MMRPRQEKQTAKRWTPEDEAMLRDLAERNTPTREIGLRLDRTVVSLRTRAKRLGIRLHLPYGPRSSQ
jgi:hypothetical protein